MCVATGHSHDSLLENFLLKRSHLRPQCGQDRNWELDTGELLLALIRKSDATNAKVSLRDGKIGTMLVYGFFCQLPDRQDGTAQERDSKDTFSVGIVGIRRFFVCSRPSRF